ncbi:hypothetical protein AUEXF2481DRAFT_44841 [Aureobasidium subglaciale EXF-2481]|uniref:Zn(2)-C6 fungal-type domain-containing protein n=1 Tax=Aureobasidium subglaciale (strain EXF-2481) TaxID=1043005 RepID=A0A074Y401_AURSE|nr:uncharacterized protein AUEXF2481DRAFT_44841 [Aureobasidium subglaciale EXF-2481]KEQ90644.1 hypothetical protein AUEXF2481DRAFT_44841 [Aureobasidium subglaciale EXF-2481]
MSAGANRKNGKQASCEPCRRGKVRCDHRMPICDRCRRRNMGSECWYHPAPLTRPSKRTRTSSPERTETDYAAPAAQTVPVTTSAPLGTLSVHAGAGDSGHGNVLFTTIDQSRRSTPLLPLLSLRRLDNTIPQHVPLTAIYDDRGNETLDGDLRSITRILGHLQHYKTIRTLVTEYYCLDQIAVVPSHLVLPVLADLEHLQEDIMHQQATTDNAVSTVDESATARRVLNTTSSKMALTSSTSLAGFVGFYSGPNLRLESIGLIFTIAARVARLGLAHHGEIDHNFVQAMFQCSAECLRLARELASEMNDVIIWLSYENLRLSTTIQGYAGSNVWRRLGGLSTDIFALELHREAAIAKAPVFLAECRRRVFAAAFHWDKFLAALFDRPPRIPGYYADCAPPSELTDDQLCLTRLGCDPASFAQADGWSGGDSCCSATWIRALYLLSQLRDKALVHHLKPLNDETRPELESVQPVCSGLIGSIICRLTTIRRKLATQCKETWHSLPTRLRYDPTCWKSDLAPISCLRSAEVYLTYLQTQFHIYRLLQKFNGSYSPHLVEACSSIIETTLQIGGLHDKADHHLYSGFRASIVLCYGLPSAITLINALRTARRSMNRAQFADLVRQVSVRRLSVFIAFLEGVYRPENANHALCIKASGLMSDALDEVLEYLLSLAASEPDITGSDLTTYLPNETQMGSSSKYLAAMENADSALDNLFEWSAADLMDMNDWMDGIDWTNASGGI